MRSNVVSLFSAWLACAWAAVHAQEPVQDPPAVETSGHLPERPGATLRPHLNYRFTSIEGLLARPGASRDTERQDFTPGVRLTLGEHWAFEYAPTWTYFSNPLFSDSVDHRLSASFASRVNAWDLSARHASSFNNLVLVETGQQTEEEKHYTNLTLAHAFDSRLSAFVEGRQYIRLAEGYTGSRERLVEGGLTLQKSAFFRFGAAATVGYIDVDRGGDSSYANALARLRWSPGKKLSFDVEGGPETRRFRSDSPSTLVTPVFAASLRYRPFEVSTLLLTASRNVAPSYFEGLVAEKNRFTAGIEQRLLGRVYATVSGTFYNVSYRGTNGGTVESRDYDYHAIDVRFHMIVFRHVRIGLFSRRSVNATQEAGLDFASDQFGAEVDVRF